MPSRQGEHPHLRVQRAGPALLSALSFPGGRADPRAKVLRRAVLGRNPAWHDGRGVPVNAFWIVGCAEVLPGQSPPWFSALGRAARPPMQVACQRTVKMSPQLTFNRTEKMSPSRLCGPGRSCLGIHLLPEGIFAVEVSPDRVVPPAWAAERLPPGVVRSRLVGFRRWLRGLLGVSGGSGLLARV